MCITVNELRLIPRVKNSVWFLLSIQCMRSGLDYCIKHVFTVGDGERRMDPE